MFEPVSAAANPVSAEEFRILKIRERRLRARNRQKHRVTARIPLQRLTGGPAKVRKYRKFSQNIETHHGDDTGWLGRLDSNQGMAESKSE
jgi:hypothetical protein